MYINDRLPSFFLLLAGMAQLHAMPSHSAHPISPEQATEILRTAVKVDDSDWTRQLLEAGADPYAPDYLGRIVTIEAIWWGATKALTALSHAGVDLNRANKSGERPINYTQNWEMLKLLALHGIAFQEEETHPAKRRRLNSAIIIRQTVITAHLIDYGIPKDLALLIKQFERETSKQELAAMRCVS